MGGGGEDLYGGDHSLSSHDQDKHPFRGKSQESCHRWEVRVLPWWSENLKPTIAGRFKIHHGGERIWNLP